MQPSCQPPRQTGTSAAHKRPASSTAPAGQQQLQQEQQQGERDTHPPASDQRPGTIEWCVAQHQRERARQQEAAAQEQQQAAACLPQLAYRSSNRCQQLLAQQLGWRAPPALRSWQAVQQQQLVLVRMHTAPGRCPAGVAGLAVQPAADTHAWHSSGSCSSSLVAAAQTSGVLRLTRVCTLQAAAATAQSAAAALPPDEAGYWRARPYAWLAAATSPQGVPAGSGWPPAASPAAGTTWQVDTGGRVRDVCWLHPHSAGGAGGDVGGGGGGVLVTSGPGGLVRRTFAEGRMASSRLRARNGGDVHQPHHVAAADPAAAYHLMAASGSGLLLWDVRVATAAAVAAAAELPAAVDGSMLLPLPGGELLLAAGADGRVRLFDVRRMSSSSVVNFGSSRAAQNVVATYNLRSAVERYSSSNGSIGGGSGSGHSSLQPAVSDRFVDHVALSPADPNLLAFACGNMQVGVFDMASGSVQQHVTLTDVLRAHDPAATPAAHPAASMLGAQLPSRLHTPHPRMLPGRVCWDSSGRTLYAPGQIEWREAEAGSDGVSVQQHSAAAGAAGSRFFNTLAAVDLGSWAGQQQRWGPAALGAGSGGGGAALSSAPQASDAAAAGGADGRPGDAATGSGWDSSCDCRWSRVSQGGQVLHAELDPCAAAVELAAAGRAGVVVGTATGDLLWLA